MKFPPKRQSPVIYPLGTTVRIPRGRRTHYTGLILECRLQENGLPHYQVENAGWFEHAKVVFLMGATTETLKEAAAAIYGNTNRAPF